jgi:thermolysin
MFKRLRGLLSACVLASIILAQQTATAQRPSTIDVRVTTAAELRQWDGYVTEHERDGRLRLRATDRDPALPARTVERYEQFYGGVRIWGADIVRDSERGVPQSIFGVLAPDALELPSFNAMPATAAQSILAKSAGPDGALLTDIELVIARSADGEYRLAYTGVVASDATVVRIFIDASSGMELSRYAEIQTQARVGTGTGVKGDEKKLSVVFEAGTYYTDDGLRPPALGTFDMRGNTTRSIAVIDGATLFASDRATDTDNRWTDPGVVDAHAYVGWIYDYYFKRHGRRGLDNRDRPLVGLINAVTPQSALSLPASLRILVDNAFWCGACGPGGIGLMYFGSGVPPAFFDVNTGQNVAPLAGSLDIVAHELTHGITDSSSRLVYAGEAGALNEAFSDMMGTSAEFFYEPPGTGRGRADYLLGEDSFRALRSGSIDGVRSMSSPALFDQPDHYSRRYLGSGDSGGVHINSGIPNNAFYLAIEGGTNRTSGLAVQGVGAANREQIEKVFYRAFVFLLPSTATFSTARVATIQAARDLYGAGSAAERAVTQAWTAVGVL